MKALLRAPVVVLLTLALAACGGSDDGAAPGSGGAAGAAGAAGAPWMGVYVSELEQPAASTAPIAVGPGVTFYGDVPYGTDPANRFDVFVPPGAGPAPMMVHIHGGGFTGGTKDGSYSKNAAQITGLLAKGVAYASVEYRLLEDVDDVGVIKPLTDCRRALQFLRYHAAAFKLDPTRVVLEGGSAGAGTSLWIALSDDMAEPGSSDPVAQQSTRVLGAAANATQATYDLMKWNTVVFAEYETDFLELAVNAGLGARILSFYGIESLDELESPALEAYRAKVDMLALMTADDPPLYVNNPLEPAVIPLTTDLLFHHAYHARVVTERADQVGLPVVAYIAALGVADPSGKDEWDFATELLTK